MLTLRDLFAGKSHFGEFLHSPERMATSILAVRPKRLVDDGLMERTPSDERAGAQAHRLTKRGRSLLPVMNTRPAGSVRFARPHRRAT